MATYYDLTVSEAYGYVQGYGFDTTDSTVNPDDQHSESTRTALNDQILDRASLQADISAQRTGFGDTHPDDDSLVLQSIAGTLVEGVPAQYDAHYVAKRVGSIHMSHDFSEEIWHKNPDGTDIEFGKEPNFRVRRIVTQKIAFRHFYYQVARPTFNTSNIETINDSPYNITLTVGNTTATILSASAKELVYGTPQEKQTTRGNTSLWVKDFVFHYRKGGWIGTRRKADGTVEEYDLYEQSTFPTVP